MSQASLARDPHVRALSMRVYPVSPRELIVTGGSEPHHVYVTNGQFRCDCRAASSGTMCSHVIAIDYLYQSYKKGNPVAFTLNRGSASAERKLYVPVPRTTMYAGLLAGAWTSRKPNPKTGVEEDKLGIRVLVTHFCGKTPEKLDEVTEGITMLSNSFFYNPKTGKSSYLVNLLAALTGDDLATVSKMDESAVLDTINDNIGSGLQFICEPVTKDGQFIGNFIDGSTLETPDEAFRKLVSAMGKKLDIAESENGDIRRYIKSPRGTEYHGAPAPQAKAVDDIVLEDEVPF